MNQNIVENNVKLFDLDPWHESVDMSQLMGEVKTSIKLFVQLKDEEAIAIAFWILHCYFIRPPKQPQLFQCSPILNITSPEKRCGKSTLRELIEELVPRPLSVMGITPSALFHTIEAKCPTFLIDEADTFLRNNNDLTRLINSGYKQDGMTMRMVGNTYDETMSFSTWCAKCIVGIGKNLMDTTKDRSITIRLKRKKNGENILSKNRVLRDDPDFFITLKKKMIRFVLDHEEQIIDDPVEMPIQMDDRTQDNWEGIYQIAAFIGEDTYNKVHLAAMMLSSYRYDDDSDGIELLKDIKQIIPTIDLEKIPSSTLVDRLNADLMRPWSSMGHKGLSQHNLANMLREFEIYPIQIGGTNSNQRGYLYDDFEDAFNRYL
jgi:putative DNA primase/helicase